RQAVRSPPYPLHSPSKQEGAPIAAAGRGPLRPSDPGVLGSHEIGPKEAAPEHSAGHAVLPAPRPPAPTSPRLPRTHGCVRRALTLLHGAAETERLLPPPDSEGREHARGPPAFPAPGRSKRRSAPEGGRSFLV